MSEKISRRDFLKLASVGAATTAVLTGCVTPEDGTETGILVPSEGAGQIFSKFDFVNFTHRINAGVNLPPFYKFEEVAKAHGFSPYSPEGDRVEIFLIGQPFEWQRGDGYAWYDNRMLIGGRVGKELDLDVLHGLELLDGLFVPDEPYNGDLSSDGYIRPDIVSGQSVVVSNNLFKGLLVMGMALKTISEDEAMSIMNEYNQVKPDVLPIELSSVTKKIGKSILA